VDGEQIREARERRGWTQERLAREVDVSVRAVGNWERGANVPKNRTGRLVELFGNDAANPIQDRSDTELLGELLRRAAERERERIDRITGRAANGSSSGSDARSS
jgi:transcriptional regulator with XRE-family HTH domain